MPLPHPCAPNSQGSHRNKEMKSTLPVSARVRSATHTAPKPQRRSPISVYKVDVFCVGKRHWFDPHSILTSTPSATSPSATNGHFWRLSQSAPAPPRDLTGCVSNQLVLEIFLFASSITTSAHHPTLISPKTPAAACAEKRVAHAQIESPIDP